MVLCFTDEVTMAKMMSIAHFLKGKTVVAFV